MKTLSFCRLGLALFCPVLGAPLLSADTVAAAAAPKAAHSASVESKDALTKTLHDFGVHIAGQYNKHVKGNKAKKEIEKNSDGTWTAVYHEIDPKSITCSYKESSNPKGPVKYIGTLHYAEVKYVCTAKSKAAAEKGPFTPHRANTTELVKYINGKWSY